MANFAAKYSIMTQEMVDSFCDNFYIPAEVHPTAPGRDKTITQFPVGKVEKDSAPHLTARQEQTVKLLESHKAPFRRYPECFLCLVGLSPYYPFDENSYPAFERPDGTDMGLLDFIKTVDPRKVRAVEVQKGDDQVTLLESTRYCFMPLVIPSARGSSSVAATESPTPTGGGQEDVAEENAYLELADPDEGTAMVRQSGEEVVTEQPKKIKKKRLIKQSDVLRAKKLRTDHPSLTSGTGGKTLAGLEQIMPAGSRLLAREQSATPSVAPPSQESESFMDLSAQASLQIRTTVGSDSVFTVAAPQAHQGMLMRDVYPDLDGEARQICLGSEVRSCAKHELEPKEKLNAKYVEWLKSLLAEETERVETAEVVRFRDQISVLTGEVSALKITIAQKDTDISLLDSRATHLKSALYDSQAACAEAGSLITSLTSERDRLSSEVSTLHAAFQDFKEKAEAQQEKQAHVLYNRVAELEAHVMDISGRLEGELYPAYVTTLTGKRWFLTHGIQLAVLKCFKSPEYQGILGHVLGRAVDFGMQEGLEAGFEHGVAGTQLFAVGAYNPEAAMTNYLDSVRALEDVDFPLVKFLKSKKDVGMDEVLDCFILDGPLADLLKAAHLQPCLEQLSIPIHHSDDKAVVGETSLSFALPNVHSHAEGAKKHAAALRQLMMEIVSNPLSSRTWVGETSTSAAPLSVEDFDEEDTDEALGSVVAIPKFEACRF
ncbi:hypothetical protein Tco_1144725 [Tanacetum coccineum]